MERFIKNFNPYKITSGGNIVGVYGNLLKLWVNNKGYSTIRLKRNGLTKTFSIHRLVATYFVDNPNNKPVVNHRDGNKLNNHFSNLEWVSQKENAIHAIQHLNCNFGKGANKRIGENNGNCKLSDNEVKTIKFLYRENVSYTKIAFMFNVSRSQVRRISLGLQRTSSS